MSETLEEIAERLSQLAQDSIIAGEVEQAILSALRNERERAAKIAESHYEQAIDCDGGQACSLNIAKAIREGQ